MNAIYDLRFIGLGMIYFQGEMSREVGTCAQVKLLLVVLLEEQ